MPVLFDPDLSPKICCTFHYGEVGLQNGPARHQRGLWVDPWSSRDVGSSIREAQQRANALAARVTISECPYRRDIGDG
jgi:hypothetical protein